MLKKQMVISKINIRYIPKPKALRVCISTMLIAITGCSSWVSLTNAGKQVDLRISTSVENCTKIGSLTVNGIEKIGFIPRNKNKVQTELSTQARNDAAIMGANVVVPDGGVKQGRRSFIAYRCP